MEFDSVPDSAPRAARPLSSGGVAASFGDLGDVSPDAHTRSSSTIAELDRVLGGGIVPGSYMALSAEPGHGKSTLASQLLAGLAGKGARVGLVAAEESAAQVKMRFDRLGHNGRDVQITSETAVERVIDAALAGAYDLIVVDSIQTVFSLESSGTPGSITQVRECGQALMRLAKEGGTSVLLIGQVTKDGSLAGPRTLEHMVDVVMQLEGDRDQQLRILRAVKNRFGSTDEIGLFEMTGAGLIGVDDPSAALGTRRQSAPIGAATCPVIEGARPMMVEVQALVSPTSANQPIRACRGIDQKRFQMLLAVLSRHGQMRLGSHDVFLQLAGGIRVDDPALDLACCLAIASSYNESEVPLSVAAFGEVSLLGEIRPAPQSERRLSEASRLGYSSVIQAPAHTSVVACLEAVLGGNRQLSTGPGEEGP